MPTSDWGCVVTRLLASGTEYIVVLHWVVVSILRTPSDATLDDLGKDNEKTVTGWPNDVVVCTCDARVVKDPWLEDWLEKVTTDCGSCLT